MRQLLDRPTWWEVPAINKALRPILSRLAARYLTATDERGRALDRVAHFHLGNGAVVERLNWLADTSANGLKQSYAMMVNYRYKLGDVDANHEAYATGKIVASRDVRALAKGWVRSPRRRASATLSPLAGPADTSAARTCHRSHSPS